jgi:hypothetical protein
MSQLRQNARTAKAMLGRTGTVKRVAALATVYRDGDEWVVESIDSDGDGGIYFTAFSGPRAERRALEYAQEKYSGFQLSSLPHSR